MILEKIKNANDIKNIPPESYDALAEEIREFLIQSISKGDIWHPIWERWS